MDIDPLAITQIGLYPVRRFIAQGGMAWVFEVLDPRFEGQEVIRALKMLKPEAAVGEEFLRFRQEAGLLAGIDHPNLVTIFDFGQDDETGCFFYVMTYVDGATMADYIHEYHRLTVDAVGPVFLEILSALGELHDRGIVHRDIKPANILIGSDNRARLSDLGIARAESSDLETRTNIALGTVKFMAPEQARGRTVSPASDVYSVGLTLYYALTGEYVYDQIDGIDSTSQLDVLGYLNSLEFTGDSIDFSFDRALEIPAEIQAVVKRAVRYQVQERYENAREMHDDLRDALYGDPHPPSRSRWPVIASAGAAITAVMGFAIYNYVVVPRMLESEVRLLEDTVRPLRLDVPATLQRVRDIENAIDLNLVGEVETAIGSAQTAWQYAQEDIQGSQWTSATANLRRAHASFDTACDILGRAKIRTHSEVAMTGFNSRLSELGDVYRELEAAEDLSEVIKQTWAELQTNVTQLGVPPNGAPCGTILLALDQIDTVAGAEDNLRSLADDLASAGPVIAEKARATATASLRRAEADSVQDRAYRDEITKGKKLLRDGDRLVATEPLRARELFTKANKTFESAAEVVPAIRARSNLLTLERELPRGGDKIDLASARTVIAEAAEHFANGEWSLAESAYTKAATTVRSLLGSELVGKEAINLRNDAREYRLLAQKDATEKISPISYASADRAFARAESAFDQKDFENAAESYGQASKLYREARSSATDALQATQNTKTDLNAQIAAFLNGNRCANLESPTALSDCDAALSAAAAGDQALDEIRITAANNAYARALRALTQAIVTENDFQGTKPVRPVLVDRFPRSETVDVLRGSPQRLEITAEDSNENDKLSFRWRFDGEIVDTVTGSVFEFTPKRAGKVSVAVTDNTGLSFETSWQIRIKNLPPELTVIPKGTIRLARGQSQSYTASAKDPDGTPVSIEFLLNGKRVSQSNQYTFKKTAPGDYRLEIVTRDVDGATARATRKIQIINRAPDLTVTPSRDVSLEPGQNQRFEARASDPEHTEVKVTYRIAGKAVGRGNSYTFAKTEPGTYELEIRAKDIDNGTTTVRRKIIVRAGNNFPNPTTTWQSEIIKALRQYEAALESKDIAKLERVWRFKRTDPLRDIWKSRFRKYDDVSIRISLKSGDWRLRGDDQALLSFTQVESLDGRDRTWNIRATLLKRAAGWQIIDYARSR